MTTLAAHDRRPAEAEALQRLLDGKHTEEPAARKLLGTLWSLHALARVEQERGRVPEHAFGETG